MAGNYLSNPSTQWLDDNGDPLSGGKLNFWEAGGTSVRQDTFTDKDLTGGNENVNPVILDSDGRSPTAIFLQQSSYNIVVTNSAGTTQTNASRDNVSNILQVDISGSPSVDTYAAMTALLKANLSDGVTYRVLGRSVRGDIGPVFFEWVVGDTTTANSGTVLASDEAGTGRWLMRFLGPINVLWFGPNTTPGTTNMAAIIQTALDAVGSNGGTVFFPAGRYLITAELVVNQQGTVLVGEGPVRISFPDTPISSSIVLGANITGSMLVFEKDASAQVLKGCGVKQLSFDGVDQGFTVSEAAIHLEAADIATIENVTIFDVAGGGLLTKRCVRSYFANIDITGCGESGQPGFYMNETDSSNFTQGCTLVGIRIEAHQSGSYVKLSALAENNKLTDFHVETSSSIAATEQTYLEIAGDRNIFRGWTMNKNGGTSPRIDIVSGAQKNIFSDFISAGSHGGDVVELAGDQNILSNFSITGGGADVWAFDLSSNNNQINNVFLNDIKAFNLTADADNTLVNGMRLVNAQSTVFTDAGSAASEFYALHSDESTGVASATALPMPFAHDVVHVTGTTTITSVTGGWRGRQIVLIFDDILTFTDGNNLKLAGNFVTSSVDTITLKHDGSNWYEVARSAN